MSTGTSDLYSNTLSALNATRAAMLSPAWQTSIDAGTAADRLAASQKLIQVQQAILALSEASLSEIATEMQENAADLSNATDALNAALKDLTKVENVLDTATELLGIVAKIVTLV